MTWSQRLVNMLYLLRDYAPMTNVLALALLPIALYPTQADDSVLEQADSLWLRRTFLVAFIAYKLNHYNVYNHIGLSRVLNFQSNEFWAAPCTSGIPASYYIHTTSFENRCSLTSFVRRHGLPLHPVPPTRQFQHSDLRSLRHHHLCRQRALSPPAQITSSPPLQRRHDLICALYRLRLSTVAPPSRQIPKAQRPFCDLVAVPWRCDQASRLRFQNGGSGEVYDLATDGAGLEGFGR